MAIDISCEQLVALRNVPKLLPRRPNGKYLHISAVYRWVQRGVKGVKLETVRIGGTSYTSHEAIERFGVSSHDEPAPKIETPAHRTKRAERARREVQRLLYPNGHKKSSQRRVS